MIYITVLILASTENIELPFANPTTTPKRAYDYGNEHTATSFVQSDILKSTSPVLDKNQIMNGNEITVGTKPPKVQHQKSFLIQVRLTINDIQPYLDRSNKYCKECRILYPNKYAFVAHMKSRHLEKIYNISCSKIKKKSKHTRIPNCNSTRGLERYYKAKHKRNISTSIKKFVKATNMPLKEKSETNSKHFCSHCQKLFPNVNALIEHMYDIFKAKKHKTTFDQGLNKSGRSFEHNMYICPFCSYYFRTTKYYSYHILKRHNTAQILNIKKVPIKLYCKKCNLKFKSIKDYNSHIYNSHLQPTILKINSIKKALNPNNETITPEAMVTNTSQVQVAKSNSYRSVLFKCTLCNVYFLSAKMGMKHLHHSEITINWKCNICQRIFKSNDKFWHENQHIYSNDFKVYNLDNSVYQKVLFKCLQCTVHFTEENYLLHSSLCGTKTFLSACCVVCNILIDNAAMKDHKYSHDYYKFQKSDYIIIDPGDVLGSNNENTLSATLSIPQDTQMKKLITKDLDCTMPNILFLCKNCIYATDSYDETVYHCQNHCQSAKEIIAWECNICYLRFSENDSAKHKKLHEKKQWNTTLSKVFSYDNAYFLSENEMWTRHLFGPLSNKEMIKEHTQTSIYQYEHRLKLHIIQDGLIDLTVYKCEKCCRFIDPIFLFKHVDSCSLNLRIYPCPVCGLPFISIISRTNHEMLHKTFDVGLKSYKIISFNRDEDAIFNKNIIDSYNQYLLFQCRTCNVAVNKGEVEHHKLKCSNYDTRKCNICGLIIYKSDYESHTSKHKDLKGFNENIMKIVLFGKRNYKSCKFPEQVQSSFQGVIIDYTFYKCSKCAICIKDLQSKLEHSCDFSISRSKCPKCSVCLYTIYIHEHLKMHEREVEFKQKYISIVTFDINKLCEQRLNQDPKLGMLPVVVLKSESNLVANKKILVKNKKTKRVTFYVNPETGDSVKNVYHIKKYLGNFNECF